jgi:predicted RND superfamily exporter protein
MSQLSLTSCGGFTSSQQANVDAWVANYAACADEYIVDSPSKCSESTSAGFYFDATKFNAKFKTGSTKLTMTKSTFPMDTSKYDATLQWLLDLDEAGSLKLGTEYFSVAYSTSDESLLDLKTDEALMRDMFLAMASSLVITLLLWAHTGSLLLTLGGFLQIMMALPSAIFFQTVVLGITFFPFLNFLGVFVIAGIGADDCFVFYDKWMQAKSRMPPGASASEVAKECYWEAAWAMLLTSTTTAVAFASSAIIPIAPIRVFSIFMCAMVIFDYVYDITIFAAMLAWTHDASLRAEKNGGKGYSLICLDLFAFCAKRKAAKAVKGSEDTGLLRSTTIHQSAVPLPE